MSGEIPRSRTVEGLPAARERRSVGGILGAIAISVALWACLMVGVLGLIFKILA